LYICHPFIIYGHTVPTRITKCTKFGQKREGGEKGREGRGRGDRDGRESLGGQEEKGKG